MGGCGVVWCGMVWCGVVWCSVVWCSAHEGGGCCVCSVVIQINSTMVLSTFLAIRFEIIHTT